MSQKVYFYMLVALLAGNIQISCASRRFVLSGGPGIGKTTVLKELRSRGYQTIPETFTSLFEQAVAHNALDSFFNGPEVLPSILLTEQLRMESLLSSSIPAFLDRSAVDIIAYGDFFNTPMTEELRAQADRNYDLIFFLEPLPEYLYENTSVRKESREEALTIHRLLKAAYLHMGYMPHQLIEVPFGTPSERAQYILDEIAQVYFYMDILDSFVNNTSSYLLPGFVEKINFSISI